MTEPMIDLLENKIKTLRNILGGDEPCRFPEAEKLAAEVVRLYDVGFCLPSGLQPLPLIINYTVELMDNTDKINKRITQADEADCSKQMKTFRVETIGTIYTTYIVSAETEDEAREQVFLGQVKAEEQEEVGTELHEITEETNNQ